MAHVPLEQLGKDKAKLFIGSNHRVRNKNKSIEIDSEQVRLFFTDDNSEWIIPVETIKKALKYYSDEKCF